VCLLATVTSGIAASSESPPADIQRLEGRWVRPDGGYVMELREFGSDGSLAATYYNPKPIHVGRAGWRSAGQGIDLFVELRDVNYPGSIYTLHYDPVADRMQGIYFQAVQQQTYQVIFTRSR
jgi:hypothetical protein